MNDLQIADQLVRSAALDALLESLEKEAEEAPRPGHSDMHLKTGSVWAMTQFLKEGVYRAGQRYTGPNSGPMSGQDLGAPQHVRGQASAELHGSLQQRKSTIRPSQLPRNQGIRGVARGGARKAVGFLAALRTRGRAKPRMAG